MIRPCVVADIPGMERVINEAAEAYRGAIPPDRWHEPYMPREELEGEIAAGVKFWCVEDAGEVIGVMGLQDVKDVTLIRHAYVLRDRQRSGVGSALMKELVAKATRPLLVGTWAAAGWAIRFYERHGFELVPQPEKDRLLDTYWSIPARQRDTSVVLRKR
jgi:N-acetylglutamate synthase-like GNAT family acetyltransferase